MYKFSRVNRFRRASNQMIRKGRVHALPWIYFEDDALCTCFMYDTDIKWRVYYIT